jgi:D-glycero-alpha-D-manno-heptose-7-phosphate kinase
MIATTAALARMSRVELDKEEIRVIAQNVEAQLIRVPTGCQDYYPALYGGVSSIHLDVDGIHREKLSVSNRDIESRFLLVYTGVPRQSGINNWEVCKAHINGDSQVFSNFAEITAIAQQMRNTLAKSRVDWAEVARLLLEEWTLRKTNIPGITTPLIESLVSIGMKKGARAAKVCGAGGGGCFILLVEPDAQAKVRALIESKGGRVLPFRVGRQGLRVQES